MWGGEEMRKIIAFVHPSRGNWFQDTSAVRLLEEKGGRAYFYRIYLL
jgi:hypothetical protein